MRNPRSDLPYSHAGLRDRRTGRLASQRRRCPQIAQLRRSSMNCGIVTTPPPARRPLRGRVRTAITLLDSMNRGFLSDHVLNETPGDARIGTMAHGLSAWSGAVEPD